MKIRKRGGNIKPDLEFSHRIMRWQAAHGRNRLPWQNTRDPYRVWLSEIMLQQTQVATVLGYYARFLEKFPDVLSLAAAPEDEVLGQWSGLGYYSRARNLHRCAQEVVSLHAGAFPRTAHELQALPGIGRSTAAAIASFCFGERVAILDGNVKRVLTRVFGFDEDLAIKTNENRLWDKATELLPIEELAEAMPRYTQGLMDLGATVCTTRQPQCLICPVQDRCVARLAGTPERYPVRTRKLKRSAEAVSLLWAHRQDGAMWLEKRPAAGIWGGLYCFPVFASDDDLRQALPDALHRKLEPLPGIMHVLTHKDLYLSAWRLEMAGATTSAPHLTPASGLWFAAGDWPALGLPAPIRKLLEQHSPA
jgi:A/G-specific adenine glycosylase